MSTSKASPSVSPKNPKGKYTTQLMCAVVLCIAGIILIMAGFIVEPRGEISASVLVAYGEMMTFAGALFGIDYHSRK